jgi:hypothetical protein
MRVYIASPIYSGDNVENVARAIERYLDVVELGYAGYCPHLSWYINPNVRLAVDEWMRQHGPWLTASSAVLITPSNDPVTTREIDLAAECGVPVWPTVEELDAYLGGA